ncbi:MAG: glycosyltransferase family 2 protein, partial [Cyanobacteria bacterium P01_D01_bin.105]
SDDLAELPKLLAEKERYDLVLGNRRGTPEGRSQLTAVQRFGNWLATRLIRLGWGQRYEDLGPLRLIRRRSLDALNMRDRGFGWTVEMQAKAAEHHLRILEKPVKYHPRQGGKSKISGTLKGSFQAGTIILTTLGQLYGQKIKRTVNSILSSAAAQQILRSLSLLLLILGSILAMPHGDFTNQLGRVQADTVPLFWRGAGLMGLGFIGSWGLKRIPSLWFWLGAIAPRLILLAMHPGDDIWRYLWEGHIQLSGFNPYLLTPNAEILTPLRETLGATLGTGGWEFINHPDHAAIYPPITQLGFRGLAAITTFIGSPILLFKLSFVAADLAICWLLSRRFGHQAALLYAWNPLIIYSFAGGGHYDSWFLLPVVVAWLGWGEGTFSNRTNGSAWEQAIAIGISIAIKWMSLPVLAFLAWRRWPRGIFLLALGLLPLLLSAVPFCSGTGSTLTNSTLSCPVLPLESSFVNYGRSAAFIPHFIAMLWPSTLRANWIYAIPLGLSVLWNMTRTGSIGAFTERYFISLLLLSPIIHAWYFAWLVPFATQSRNWGTQWVSLSAFAYFGLHHHIDTQQWVLTPAEYSLLWGPFVAGLMVSALLASRARCQNLLEESLPKETLP